MRVGLILMAIGMAACVDRPGAGPRIVPPPPSPPSRQVDVFDQIDSAKRATDAQERAMDDARTQRGLLDSLVRERENAITDTMRRVRMAPRAEQR